MPLSRVQAVAAPGEAAEATATLDTTAVEGNLLVAFQVTSSPTAVDVPTGFTLVVDGGTAGAVTGVLSLKVADGTETEVVFPDNGGGNRAIVVEIGGDSPELDVFAEDESNLNTVVTAQSTGTTGTTAVDDEIAMAFITFADQRFANGTQSFDNGFTLILEGATGASSPPAAIYGEKTLTATGTVETTCTTDDTGDEAYGCIMTVREAAVAGGGGFRSRIAGGLVIVPA